MADSEKAPEQQQQQAPAKTEGSKNDSAVNPPATEEQQQPKQIIGEWTIENEKKNNRPYHKSIGNIHTKFPPKKRIPKNSVHIDKGVSV